jgi:hypothetical protein
MKFFNRTLLILSTAGTLFMSVGLISQPKLVYADAADDVCKGIGAVSGEGECKPPTGTPDAQKIVSTVVNLLSIVVGIISVIMIIFGGIRFVMSSGDAQQASSARNTVIYALVGLVTAFTAQILVRFVLGRLEG